jgi:hypothetical protein
MDMPNTNKYSFDGCVDSSSLQISLGSLQDPATEKLSVAAATLAETWSVGSP